MNFVGTGLGQDWIWFLHSSLEMLFMIRHYVNLFKWSVFAFESSSNFG